MENIRLSEFYVEAIAKSFRKFFDEEDHLWLFGSRVDMNKKGGDIDLYIKTISPDILKSDDVKFQFVQELWRKLGEQKIDVVINNYSF